MTRTIIITGASKGIGKAIAMKLAEHKTNLVLVARSNNELVKMKNEIEALGSLCLPISIDLTSRGSVQKIIAATAETFGTIDILINNAGLAMSLPIQETSEEDWNKIMNLNVRVPFFLSKAAIPYLAKSNRGTIINIASVVGRKGYINQAAYASSKHALTGFTKVLSEEVKPLGIIVHLISPGGVATEMVTKMRPEIESDSLIQPEEIAEIIEFLLLSKGRSVIDEVNIRRFDAPGF
jgi:3-oxoacyl-[acyl-carrier protein] reductase